MARTVPAGDGNARVSRETMGHGGKAVRVVRGLPLDADTLAALGKPLHTACGSGGTVKVGVLEVQNDHTERVRQCHRDEGWQSKKAGR
jgi:translation initiation factor 1